MGLMGDPRVPLVLFVLFVPCPLLAAAAPVVDDGESRGRLGTPTTSSEPHSPERCRCDAIIPGLWLC